jgi:hypothetical protein
MTTAIGLAASVLVLVFGTVSAARGAVGDPPKPRLGLFVEQSDIARARQRSETVVWATEYRARTMKIADAWVARSDEWIREILPKPGAKFSYGSAGCPSCGKEWGRFGSLVASLDRPLVLICTHCKTEFDLNQPKEPYNDTGDGVVVNGRRFWLRGVWNAFVVDQMWSAFHAENAAIVNLADAYAFTGDERYAKKAIVIMDALATLSPQTRGPEDFSTNPKDDEGRLQHLTSMVFRAQVHLARALDLVGRHDDLLQPSPTNPSRGSAWENIHHGIFEEYLFIPLDVRGGKLHTLHNHEADSVRAMLLHGLMFGNADHVRWGAEATTAFLDNTIDRDGMYYETSLTYADFTRSVFIDLVELLVRYDPTKYPASADMPKRADLPLAGNYFNHGGLARLTLDVPGRVSMLGRGVTYGNNHFDERVWKKSARAFYRPELTQAQRFYLYSTDEPRRAHAARVALTHLAQAGEQGVGGWWALYRAPNDALLRHAAGIGDPTTQPAPAIPTEDRSDFLGQTGLVFLRAGEGEHRRGAVMRVGPTLPHGHDDVGGLLLFANGRALSGDIGYGIFGNHTHLGWASRGVAHHTVVVNQDATNPDQLFRIGPGGTIERFYDGGMGGGGVALTEASLGAMYAKGDGVRDARRLIVQLDLWPTQSYWLDLFDVDGGRVHDYVMHANPLGKNGSFAIDGAQPKPQDGVWALASLDPKWRDAPFNKPKQSWGERLTLNGMIAPIPGLKDGVEDKRDWYPPPGNGYAFIHDVKTAPAVAAPWSATWRWDEKGDRFGLRMTMLPDKPQQVISAIGPNLDGSDRMNFIVARRGEPGSKDIIRSRYAAVLEPFGADAPVVTAEAVRQGDRIAAIRTRAEAGEDLILDARRVRVDPTNLPGLDAGVAVVRRRSGSLAALVLHGGTKLEVDGFALQFASNRHSGKITAIDDAAGTFRVTPPLPVASIGSAIRIGNSAYSHGSLYRVANIGTDGDVTVLNAALTLGRGRVDALKEGDVFTSTAPLVYGFEYGRSTRFLDGKRIVMDDQTGTITAQTDFKDLKVAGIKPQTGAEFIVYDVQVGDTVEMDAAASLVEERGEWVLRANATVDVRFPFLVERATGESWFRSGDAAKVESLDLSAGPVRFRRAK